MTDPKKLITTPCSEDWNAMTGDEQLRHCEKCDTDVLDLTGMTAVEIQTLKTKNGGKLCGMFRLGPAVVRPLAVGTGIASLALASCSQEEIQVVGGIGHVPSKPSDVSRHDAKPFSDAPEKPISVKPTIGKSPERPFLLGIICEPPKKRN